MKNEQKEQSHLLRQLIVLLTMIAIVIAAVVVLRGADKGSAAASVSDAKKETVQTVNASPALDAPLTKAQETLERQQLPVLPYEDPTAAAFRMAEDIREMDALIAAEQIAEEPVIPQETEAAPAPEPQPAPAPQPQPTPAPALQPAPAPAAQPAPEPLPVPVISEDAEDCCITDGVTY